MSESSNNPNQNIASAEIDPSDLHLKNVPEALQLDQLEELAKMGDEFRARGDFASMSPSEKEDKTLLQINDFLESHGISRVTSDPVEREAYDYAFDVAADAYDQGVVGMYGTSEGEDKSNLELIVDKIQAHYNPDAHPVSSPETTDDSASEEKLSVRQRLTGARDRLMGMLDGGEGDESSAADDISNGDEDTIRERDAERSKFSLSEEQWKEMETELDEISKEYAKQEAKQSESNLGFQRKKVGITYDVDENLEKVEGSAKKISAKEMLADQLTAMGSNMFFELVDAGIPEEEASKQVEAFMAEKSDAIVAQFEESRLDQSRLTRWLGEKWGGAKKWQKATVLAGAGLAVGATGGLLGVGLIGAGLAGGAAAAGAVGWGGRTVGRSFIKAKLNQSANNESDAKGQVEGIKGELEGSDAKIDTLNLIETSANKYRRRNTRRLMGDIAIGGTIGGVFGVAGGYVGDLIQDHVNIGERLGGIFDGDTGHNEAPSKQLGGVDAIEKADQGGGGSETVTVSPPVEVVGRGDLFDGFHATRELTPEGKEAILDNLNNYTVKSGDTIWDVSEKMLEEQGVKNPSVYEIDATKDFLVRKLQDQGYADSRGWLNAGDTIKLR